MADEDWLTLENINGTNAEHANGILNQENPAQHADHSQEVQMNYDYECNEDRMGNEVVSLPPSKYRCYTRRRMVVVLIGIIIATGVALGLSLTVLSPSSGVSANNSFANGRNKSENHGINGNGVSAPGNTITSSVSSSSSTLNIADIINSAARNGGDEFKDMNSYQSLAKTWVLTQDFPISDGSSMTIDQQAIQLYALACIYYATFSVKNRWTDVHYGPDVVLPGWYSSRGWLGIADDVCSNWHGLSCNDEGRIIKIELDSNGLTGSFPPEIALLRETLNTIDLYNNIVHNAGDEGNLFLGELTNLEYLYLGTTSFEYDGVPSVLGKLTTLKELDFSYSMYYGNLDGATFSNLSNLRYLAMDGNAYNSFFPPELAELPNLEYLYAGFSFLEGGLDFVTSMNKIVELWVDDNPSLKGSIPSGIGNLANLASLSASNCALTGTIPTEIGKATNMIQMWFNDNNLTGEIPTEIANLATMRILNVQNNDLIGDMPSKICDRRRPFGRLEELGADCDDAITCGEDCCTCCGNQCSST